MSKCKLQETTEPFTASTLAAAVEENNDAKLRAEGAASDLANAGAMLNPKITAGIPELAAPDALKVIKEVEGKVQECADDLDSINMTLAGDVATLERTEEAVAVARTASADTRSALTASNAAEHGALLSARHDSATGLPNREHFDSRLTHSIAVGALPS